MTLLRKTSPTRMTKWMVLSFATVLFFGIVAILSLDFLLDQGVDVAVGEKSPSLILSPQEKSFVSTVATEKEKELAANRVADTYTAIDRAIGREQVAKLHELFEFVRVLRADQLAIQEWKISSLQQLELSQFSAEQSLDLLLLSDSDLAIIERESASILSELMRGEIRQSGLASVPQAVRRAVGFNVTQEQEVFIQAITPQFVVENSFLDDLVTQSNRNEAQSDVVPITKQIFKGDVIVRKGETVTDVTMESLDELGMLQRTINWWNIIRNVLMAVSITTLLFTYYWRNCQRSYERRRHLMVLTFFFLIFAGTSAIMVPLQNDLSYLFPAMGLAIVIGSVFDSRMGMITTIALAGTVGYLSGGSLEQLFYTVAGSFVAIFSLRDAERVTGVFRACLLGVLGNWISMAIFNLAADMDGLTVLRLAGLGVANGLISAGIALVLLYLVGALFGVVTMVQLQDLSRFDHPLLHELLRRSPGTYHHSTMVATLAEQAADRIGANSLLARVGAFYHDIGKMENSAYFSENQDGHNPHDFIDPQTSADLIIGHVTNGLQLAQKHRLPDRIQDFIVEHHGDQVLTHFYKKAQTQSEERGENPELVDITHFQYPGPRPRTRETALVMLSDAIEATSKAVQPNNELAIEKLVHSIINGIIKRDQLDDCGLSMREIRLIRESFIETLKGRFHARVKYAGNEELVKQNTPTKNLVQDDIPENEAILKNGI